MVSIFSENIIQTVSVEKALLAGKLKEQFDSGFVVGFIVIIVG